MYDAANFTFTDYKLSHRERKHQVAANLHRASSRIFQWIQIYWWLGSVVVMVLDSRWADRGFDSRPLHCWATTLGKLFTPMCLCSPSSIIRYLARAFMLTCLYVAAIHGSNEQGEYCSSGSAASQRSWSLEPRYKLSTLLFFTLLNTILCCVLWQLVYYAPSCKN